jgi:hypothetical protein
MRSSSHPSFILLAFMARTSLPECPVRTNRFAFTMKMAALSDATGATRKASPK